MLGLHLLDWIILVLLAAGTVWGYHRGLIRQLVSLTGLIAAYYLAYKYYEEAAVLLRRWFSFTDRESLQNYKFLIDKLHIETYVSNAIAFALLFFLVKIVWTVLGRIFHLLATVPGLNLVNRSTGALLAAAEVLVLVIVAVNVMTVIQLPEVQRALEESVTAPYLIKGLPTAAGKLQELWNSGVKI